jgi:hypothetical protein
VRLLSDKLIKKGMAVNANGMAMGDRILMFYGLRQLGGGAVFAGC